MIFIKGFLFSRAQHICPNRNCGAPWTHNVPIIPSSSSSKYNFHDFLLTFFKYLAFLSRTRPQRVNFLPKTDLHQLLGFTFLGLGLMESTFLVGLSLDLRFFPPGFSRLSIFPPTTKPNTVNLEQISYECERSCHLMLNVLMHGKNFKSVPSLC